MADFVCWTAIVLSAMCAVVWGVLLALVGWAIVDKVLELVSDWLRSREC